MRRTRGNASTGGGLKKCGSARMESAGYKSRISVRAKFVSTPEPSTMKRPGLEDEMTESRSTADGLAGTSAGGATGNVEAEASNLSSQVGSEIRYYTSRGWKIAILLKVGTKKVIVHHCITGNHSVPIEDVRAI